MEEHVIALQKACRICCQFFPDKELSKASKYRDQILAVYELDISDDDKYTHPASICNKCRLASGRAHTRIKEGKVFGGKLIQPHVFVAHQAPCALCTNFAAYSSSLRPELLPSTSVMSAASSSSSGPGSAPTPNIDVACRMLFTEPLGKSGKKKIWSAKQSLKDVRKDHARRRAKDASVFLTSYCEERKEDKTDLLYFLLSENLREVQDERYKELLSSWRHESRFLTADDCLAARVTATLTKGQYRDIYRITKEKGDAVLTPPHVLDELEKNYMPGNVRFQLSGQASVYHHTPVKGLFNTEYGQITFEPVDIGQEFQEGLETPFPNFRAVAWPYPHALAKTLEELDEEIKQGMREHGLDPSDDHLVFTTIKDGADGMGDVSIIREASDRMLPDKAFRAAFTVVRCQVKSNEELLTVYEAAAPNSVYVTRPLLEAVGDENNKASARLMMEQMQTDMKLIEQKELKVNVESGWRRHKCKFYTSMIDEKLDRAEGGLQGSGSRYLCTLCHATKETARSDLGSFNISRTREEVESTARYIQVNPDSLTHNELDNISMGIKAQPVLAAEPSQKLLDATHADINMGAFFKKIIICEMAGLQTWNITSDVKPMYQNSEKMLNDHLHTKIGLVPALMMPGNQARELLDERNTHIITELINNDERRQNMQAVLTSFQNLRSVYRAHHPEKEAIGMYKQRAVLTGELLRDKFPYVAWSNYLHKLFEHVQEILEDPHGPESIGAMSGEGNEAANKLFRQLRTHFSRKHSALASLRDVLWFHWLYTSPKLRRIGTVRTRKYQCSKCKELGHSVLHCPKD